LVYRLIFLINHLSLVVNTPELGKQVEEIRWRHQIDLNNGIITQGEIDTSARLKKIHMGRI
jgi:hypothetical protein